MTADAILAELLTDSACADRYPQYRAAREPGPSAPLIQGVAGATPFAAVATGYDLLDEVPRDPACDQKGIPGWQQLISNLIVLFNAGFEPAGERLVSLGFGAGSHCRVAVARAGGRLALPRLFDRFPMPHWQVTRSAPAASSYAA